MRRLFLATAFMCFGMCLTNRISFAQTTEKMASPEVGELHPLPDDFRVPQTRAEPSLRQELFPDEPEPSHMGAASKNDAPHSPFGDFAAQQTHESDPCGTTLEERLGIEKLLRVDVKLPHVEDFSPNSNAVAKTNLGTQWFNWLRDHYCRPALERKVAGFFIDGGIEESKLWLGSIVKFVLWVPDLACELADTLEKEEIYAHSPRLRPPLRTDPESEAQLKAALESSRKYYHDHVADIEVTLDPLSPACIDKMRRIGEVEKLIRRKALQDLERAKKDAQQP